MEEVWGEGLQLQPSCLVFALRCRWQDSFLVKLAVFGQPQCIQSSRTQQERGQTAIAAAAKACRE